MARVILLSTAGMDGVTIAAWLDLSPEAVSRIRRRFVEAGVDGVRDRPKAGCRDHTVPADTSSRSSTHHAEAVRAWLTEQRHVQFHYTPTSASCLTRSKASSGSWPSNHSR